MLVFMTAGFLVAKTRKRIDTVDTLWGLGFIVVAWSTVIQANSWRSLLVAILVSIWGFRLANHIYRRSKNKSEDPRYMEIASKWKGSLWPRAYVSIFLLQGVLVLLVGLPILMIADQKLAGWEWLIVLGVIIWLKGFIIESIADRQLKDFLALKDRPKVLQTGLWRYSRHPNYFGELTQWWGIGVISLSVSYGWIGLLGPLLLSILIIFVSGIPPIERRRAKDPEYHAYQKRTSALVLLPPRSQ